MANRIKHLSDLPEWYGLDKYEKAKSLDPAGWYEQLLARKRLLIAGGLDHKKSLDGPPKTTLEVLEAELLTLVRTTPIIKLSRNDPLRAFIYSLTGKTLLSGGPSYTRGIDLTTVRSFYRTERLIQREKRDYARKYFSRYETDEWLYPEKYRPMDWMDGPIDAISRKYIFSLSVNVELNLLVPDNVLEEHFRELLQDIRTSLAEFGPQIENKQRLNFELWQNYGVLPYLDLKIWESETGIKIPNRVMADAIFPVSQGGEETVRKTTAKMAKSLLTQEHLETLAAVAAQHIIKERKPGRPARPAGKLNGSRRNRLLGKKKRNERTVRPFRKKNSNKLSLELYSFAGHDNEPYPEFTGSFGDISCKSNKTILCFPLPKLLHTSA